MMSYGTMFGIFTTVLLGIGSGTVGLTDIVPADYIHYAKNWALFLSTINSAILTGLVHQATQNGGAK